jgi:F-type H+-transporting ATPase subunit c
MIESVNSILVTMVLGAEEVVQTAAEVKAAATMQWGVVGVLGAVLAIGIIIFGAARGISRIASAAVEAIARQPEAGGRIFTTMLLASAFIEGGMLFGLIVCFMAILMVT